MSYEEKRLLLEKVVAFFERSKIFLENCERSYGQDYGLSVNTSNKDLKKVLL